VFGFTETGCVFVTTSEEKVQTPVAIGISAHLTLCLKCCWMKC